MTCSSMFAVLHQVVLAFFLFVVVGSSLLQVTDNVCVCGRKSARQGGLAAVECGSVWAVLRQHTLFTLAINSRR